MEELIILRMIYEESYDIEALSNNCWKFSIPSQE